MSRYIDANWIAQELEWWRDKLAETHGENDEYVLCLGEVLMKLDDTPTADVRENVKGRWVEYPDCLKYDGAIMQEDFVCSECKAVFSAIDNEGERFNFCPNCGADMRGEA